MMSREPLLCGVTAVDNPAVPPRPLLCCVPGRLVKEKSPQGPPGPRGLTAADALESRQNLTAFPGSEGSPPFAAAPSSR